MLKTRRLPGGMVAAGATIAALGLATVATDLARRDPNDRAITLTATWSPSMSQSVEPSTVRWEIGPAGAPTAHGDALVTKNHWQAVVHAKRGDRVALYPVPTEDRTPACVILNGHQVLVSGTWSCVVPVVP